MSQRSEMQAEIDRLRRIIERVAVIADLQDGVTPREKVARIQMAIAGEPPMPKVTVTYRVESTKLVPA